MCHLVFDVIDGNEPVLLASSLSVREEANDADEPRTSKRRERERERAQDDIRSIVAAPV
jgi:hypothetical protein